MAKEFLTTETVNSRIKDKGVQLIDDEANSMKSGTFQCNTCNHIFSSRVGKILYNKKKNNVYCPRCEYAYHKNQIFEQGGKLLTTEDEFDQNKNTKIVVQCLVCDQEFNTTVGVFYRNSFPCGCNIRARKYSNLKGTKIGHLTVISNMIYKNDRGGNCVRAICRCGNMRDLPLDYISSCPNKSNLGCRKCFGARRSKAIRTWNIGDKYNSLTIISDEGVVKQNRYVQTQCPHGHIERSSVNDLILGRKRACMACSLLRHNEHNKKEADKYLAKINAVRITENIPNGKTDVHYQCVCGRRNKIKLTNLKTSINKGQLIHCRCNKYQKGVGTSGAALIVHNNLGRGVHNFPAKCGNIDIAMVYKNKKIAIEYDEWYWHKDASARDLNKTKKLLNDGWYVLRIRVNGHIPQQAFLQKALKRLLASPTRLLILTHKSWRGYN